LPADLQGSQALPAHVGCSGVRPERQSTSEGAMKVSPVLAVILALVSLSLPACKHQEEQHHEAHKITATSPQSRAITITQPYVCQIHSKRHIKVRALQMGYLEAITVKEGQQVKEHDLLFKVIPILYQKKAEAEKAEASLAKLQLQYAQQLC